MLVCPTWCSVCHFLLTATELQVTYQLDGASLFFVLPRSRCPPCPTASSRRPQSSRQWAPTSTPSWPTQSAGLVAVIPEGQPRRLLGLLLLVVIADQGHRGQGRRPPGPPYSGLYPSDPPPPPPATSAAVARRHPQASNDLGRCAPAAVLRNRLRLGAGATLDRSSTISC